MALHGRWPIKGCSMLNSLVYALYITSAMTLPASIEHYRPGSDGTVVVADPEAHRLRVYGSDGRERQILGRDGDPLFSDIGDFFLGERGEVTFANNSIRALVTLDAHGEVQKVWSPGEKAPIYSIDLLERLPDGGVLVGDETSGRLFAFDGARSSVRSIPWDTNGCAIGPGGSVFVVRDDGGQGCIESTGPIQRRVRLPRRLQETHWFPHGMVGSDILLATELYPEQNRAELCWVSLSGEVVRSQPISIPPRSQAVRVGNDGTILLLQPVSEQSQRLVVCRKP
jgi:hypothetical protein